MLGTSSLRILKLAFYMPTIISLSCFFFLEEDTYCYKFDHGVTGNLIKCIKDIEDILAPFLVDKDGYSYITDDKKLIFSLMEPAIEYIMKCLFLAGRQVSNCSRLVSD